MFLGITIHYYYLFIITGILSFVVDISHCFGEIPLSAKNNTKGPTPTGA